MENKFFSNLLLGGVMRGDTKWNKEATDIDKCFKICKLSMGNISIYDEDGIEYKLETGKTYFINGFKMSRQSCEKFFKVTWFHFIPTNIYIHILMLKLPCIIEVSENDDIQFPLSDDDFKEDSRNLPPTKRAIRDMKVSNYIDYVKVHLCETLNIEEDSEIAYAEQLSQVASYIHAHFAEPIKLEELSQLCGISPSFLHKLFKARLQLTPLNYQYILKMGIAEQMLTQKECSIKEIAQALSFTDSAHFNKMFKKFFGFNPTMIRDQNRNYLK